MRIGIMADIYKPHISGITNYIALHKRYLEQAGHEVFVFAFGDAEIQCDERNVVYSPGLPVVDTGYYLNFSYSRAAKHLLQSMDVVHVQHPFLSGRLALRYCRPLRIPIVFTNHTRYDLYAQTYLPLVPEEISASLLQTYMPPFCDAVDLVTTPSAGMAGVLCRLGVTSPIEVVPNGVELRLFHERCGADCRAEFGFSRDDILLVYAGRLAPEKNLDFLIQTFAGVAEAVENALLLIIGGGSETKGLKRTAGEIGLGDRIRFAGMVPYERLPDYLAACDVFVTASVSEVHPLSVIEAMAAGLPTVGLHSVGVGDTVEDGITGLLARDDPAAFAAQLTRLCLDHDLRRRLGIAARQASEKYAIDRVTKIMLAHYERLVMHAAPRKRSLGVRVRNFLERFRQ
ncbi:MAG: glycosyltransferase [Anaerolineales bacterium]|nr:glycosyltransferase [Anaerolineales bacterium]